MQKRNSEKTWQNSIVLSHTIHIVANANLTQQLRDKDIIIGKVEERENKAQEELKTYHKRSEAKLSLGKPRSKLLLL